MFYNTLLLFDVIVEWTVSCYPYEVAKRYISIVRIER